MQDVALDAKIKCVLNAKNIVFHTTFRKYLKLGTLENFQKKFFVQICFFNRIGFLTRMFFSDNFFFKEFFIAFKTITLY